MTEGEHVVIDNSGQQNDTDVYVVHSEPLPYPAYLIWSVAGRFNDLTWLPGVTSFSWEGNIRRFSIGEAHFIERMESENDVGHVYNYSLIDGPVPVRDYLASLRVEAAESGCVFVMESRSRVAPEKVAEVEHMLKAAYSAAAHSLRKRVVSLVGAART